MKLKVIKMELIGNRCAVSESTFIQLGSPKFVQIEGYILAIMVHYKLKENGVIGINYDMRKRFRFNINDMVEVVSVLPPNDLEIVPHFTKVKFRVDSLQWTQIFDTAELNAILHGIIDDTIIMSEQVVAVDHIRYGRINFAVIESMDIYRGQGLVSATTLFQFESPNNILLGPYCVAETRKPGIRSDWDFSAMGIGGLDVEFGDIFRRAFASRILPNQIAQQLGCKHVRGILLYGPSGTGKTLIARQIAKMLNTVEPKIVNGPEILNRYLGSSERQLREVFEDARDDARKYGRASPLHLIIFDEIEAICRKRGVGDSRSYDSIVNQLLAIMDGMDDQSYSNIIVIGMTNRKDMLDEALLRPGRFEVHIEIGLPNAMGRLQIFKIHMAAMLRERAIAADINLRQLVDLTKNFSGAEIEGLVRAAQSLAIQRFLGAMEGGGSGSLECKMPSLLITQSDFLAALQNDIRAMHGGGENWTARYLERDIIVWGPPMKTVLHEIKQIVHSFAGLNGKVCSVLLCGASNSGKTALAVHMAKLVSSFSTTTIITAEQLIRCASDHERCVTLFEKIQQAQESESSCIILDSVERLMNYCQMGRRFSNQMFQTLMVALTRRPEKLYKKTLIICTTSERDVLTRMNMMSVFTRIVHVPNIETGSQLKIILKNENAFSEYEYIDIEREFDSLKLSMGTKRVLELLESSASSGGKNHKKRDFIELLKKESAILTHAIVS